MMILSEAKHLTLGLVLAIGAVAMLPSAASAQATPTVNDLGVVNNFPDGIVFNVSAQSDAPIEEIRLRYTILPDGTAASGVADFEPAPSITTSFTLKGQQSAEGIYLPPGTTIEYHWEVRDVAGNTAASQPTTFFYDDIRFDWSSLEAGGVTAYYYAGSQENARAMLDVAAETIARMSELLGTTIGFPIKVWIYDSVADMRPALVRRSESYEQSIITAGVRVSSDTVLVLGTVAFDTLRHELTHVVTAAAGEGAFGELPAWLDEGTAVYGQTDPGGFGEAVERAVQRGNVLSVRSISSQPGDPAKVNLFYGQAWSLVSYLIDTYGPEKFAQLFAAFKSGKTTDEALTAVYGFDQDGLENEWRASLGLPPREEPTPGPQQPQPTFPPSNTGPPTERADDGSSLGVIIGLALGMLILAGAVGAGGLLLARRLR